MILDPTPEHIRQCADAIASGRCVAFPTETVYGLGANALDAIAVQQIFAIKGRPSTNPLIVHLSSLDHLSMCAVVEDDLLAHRLDKISCLWPGPLSVVLPKAASIPSEVTAGGSTVAIRIPNHPVALELIRTAGIPIAAPSANPSNYVSPTSAMHVFDSLGHKVPLILDGGNCQVGLESTVVSLMGDTVAVLRPGSITREELEAALNEEVRLHQPVRHTVAPSPGMQSLHYSPRTRCILRGDVTPSEYPLNTALVSFSEKSASQLEFNYVEVEILSRAGLLDEVATRLFAALRALDREDIDLIVVDSCSDDGLGLAIMDRLRRAVAQP